MKIEKPPVLSDEEKLTCSLVNSRHSYKELKTAIDEACIHQRDADVAWFKEASYVRLSQDQSLPNYITFDFESRKLVKKIQQDMLKAGWRKVDENKD